MLTWTLTTLQLPLRYTWKISRNSSTFKTNLLLTVAGGGWQGRGEAAPNVRYGETPEGLQEQFARLQAAGLSQCETVEELTTFLGHHQPAHALRFALESAFVHREAARLGQTVPQWLGIPAPAVAVGTAATLPIMEPGEVASFLEAQQLSRFPVLKVKVNREGAVDLLREVTRLLPGHPLIVDGNEAWTDADSLHQSWEQIRQLPGLNLRLLEQPLPAICAADYRALKGQLNCPVFADESVTDEADFADIARQFDGVNMKLMKAGGYLNGLRILQETRAHGLQTMIGCMVETSLGIWSAVQLSALADVCDLDGIIIVRDEPFGLVHEREGMLVEGAANK
ncbi:enolase C-terminal domain-like protein [Hymenobacter endophyticus]|uniref:Enolase C-terminal domain-like protein n=1 Tax=Hymenobacter endophyticus TaxID=3076335 RepID=A0ABU3TJ34_9BACT|nr:enolase C-terminal domain-like protein [Hymenobacter endophyticus]MDU0371235.1 enolase C-terminal domain-like protein [Hymenobacter endophyticus]